MKFEYEANNTCFNKISQKGKEFSIVKIPYSFKLLMQELTSMNVHMRMITDKNVSVRSELTKSSFANLKDEDFISPLEG